MKIDLVDMLGNSDATNEDFDIFCVALYIATTRKIRRFDSDELAKLEVKKEKYLDNIKKNYPGCDISSFYYCRQHNCFYLKKENRQFKLSVMHISGSHDTCPIQTNVLYGLMSGFIQVKYLSGDDLTSGYTQINSCMATHRSSAAKLYAENPDKFALAVLTVDNSRILVRNLCFKKNDSFYSIGKFYQAQIPGLNTMCTTFMINLFKFLLPGYSVDMNAVPVISVPRKFSHSPRLPYMDSYPVRVPIRIDQDNMEDLYSTSITNLVEEIKKSNLSLGMYQAASRLYQGRTTSETDLPYFYSCQNCLETTNEFNMSKNKLTSDNRIFCVKCAYSVDIVDGDLVETYRDNLHLPKIRSRLSSTIRFDLDLENIDRDVLLVMKAATENTKFNYLKWMGNNRLKFQDKSLLVWVYVRNRFWPLSKELHKNIPTNYFIFMKDRKIINFSKTIGSYDKSGVASTYYDAKIRTIN